MSSERQPIVAIIGGATAGAETAGFLAERGVRAVVFEQNPRPFGKIEDGLPRWHVKLRRKEYEAITERLGRAGVDFVPCTKIGRDIGLEELTSWGFSAVILAHGAWRDRPLPLEGADRYIGRGLLYQNPFIYWFNHYMELGYDGPRYEVPDGAIVVGGGLASIDVVKVIQIETVRQALAARGVDEDVLHIEHHGIPTVLAEHDLTWDKLGLVGATLFYRRRIEDMPLAEDADSDDPIRRQKTEAVRRKILDKAMQKYCFATEPLHVPVALLVDGDRLTGLRFQSTRTENGRAVPIPGAFRDVHTALVVSSIGSVPEPMPGIEERNMLYQYLDPDLGRVKGFDRVFGAGNVVTGKGNIAASRKHSLHVAAHLAADLLGLPAGDDGATTAPGSARAQGDAARVAALVGQLPPPSTEQAETITRRVHERQLAVGYTTFREWLQRVTPPDLA